LLRFLLCLACFSLLACADDDFDDDVFVDNDDLDTAAVTAVNSEDWATGAAFATTDPFADPFFFDDGTFLTVSTEPPADADAAAALVADNADQYYSPAACAMVERSGNQLTYMLSGCKGPLAGASTMDGTLMVTFTQGSNNQILFDMSSDNLRIDGTDAMLSANGVYSTMGATRTVTYKSERTLTGTKVFAGNFDSMLTWTAGSECVTRNATGTAMTSEQNVNISINGYTRCGTDCPTSGVVTATSDGDVSMLTFNGSGAARLQRDNGNMRSVNLDCD
jgi:hypothetical protein